MPDRRLSFGSGGFLSEDRGDWGWFIGGKVTFSPNAQVKWTPGTAGTPPASASWTCDPRSGTYTVTWQNGFVDTLRLSADGAQLSGTSSTGVKVSGSRTSGAAKTSPPPATTNVMALTGRPSYTLASTTLHTTG